MRKYTILLFPVLLPIVLCVAFIDFIVIGNSDRHRRVMR
jgi:hypothetical protein